MTTLHRDSWDQYAAICEKQIANLTVENERLRTALKDCANDLEASVNAEYAGTLDYPSQQAKHERDMEPVRRARELLGDDQQLIPEKE